MSNYRGDLSLGSTTYFTFTTVDSSGVAAALDSTSLLEAYINASTTPSTIGLTLETSINGRTGLNRVKAILDSTTYASGDEVSISVQTGAVGSKSLVGYVVGSLSIEARSALRPTTRGRTLAVDSSNVASADVVTIVADSTAAANLKSAFNDAAGAVPWLGIVDQGTAQAATSNTVQMRSAAAFADNTLIGATVHVFGSNQGYWQSVSVSSNTGTTDTLYLNNPFGVTPTGTITYKLHGSAAGASSTLTSPTAADNAAAVWNSTLASFVTSGTAGERLGRIPNVAAAAAGGLPTVDASNAVKVQSGTGSNQISLSGGAVIVQSGTGTGQISLASGAVTVGTNNDKTGYALSAAGVDAVWDEAQSGHTSAGTFGKYLDAQISAVSGSTLTVAAIADAVWDESQSGHTSAGTFGKYLDAQVSAVSGSTLTVAAIADAVCDELLSGHTSTGSLGQALTNIKTKTDELTFTTPGNVDANIQTVNEQNVGGTGSENDPWGPA